MMNAQPIIVVGKNRSGTKWMSNILANHPEVAAVQREGAGGIIEINEIGIVPHVFGPANIEENYIGFLALFEKSNLFLCSGLDSSIIYEKRHNDYHDFLRHFMDAYAASVSARFWLHKTSSHNLAEVLRKFPDARVIVVYRESVVDNIASTLALSWQYEHGKQGKNLFREVFSYLHHRKIEKKLLAKYPSRILSVRYEDMKQDLDEVLAKVCPFVGISPSEEMKQQRFSKNSSFQAGSGRSEVLTGWDARKIGLLKIVLSVVPLRLYDLFRSIKLCRSKGRLAPRTFQRHTFSEFKNGLGW